MRLLKLELKRVLKTRLTVILLLLALFFSALLAYLPATFQYASYIEESGDTVKLKGVEAVHYLRDTGAEIAGEVTPEKVRWAVEGYQEVLRKYGVSESYDLPEGVYDIEIRPIAPLLHGVKEAFANPNTGIAPSLMEVDPEKVDDYYGAMEGRIISLMKLEEPDSPSAQQAALSLYSEVTRPYLLFPEYPTDAMDYQMLLGFLIMCLCAVIAAPIFTSDYQTGADDILRCTKYGTAKFAFVKIISVLLICSTTIILCSAVYVVISDSLFGWESTKTSVQMLFSIVSLLDMNVAQLQWFTAASGLLSVVATVCFILFLPSKCRNVIVSLPAALVVCILPIIVYMALPATVSEWVYSVIPSSGAAIQTSTLYAALDLFS